MLTISMGPRQSLTPQLSGGSLSASQLSHLTKQSSGYYNLSMCVCVCVCDIMVAGLASSLCFQSQGSEFESCSG